MSVIYLWPEEYFVMVTASKMEKGNEQANNSKSKSMTRSLMPRELVWAHAKRQLWALFTCSCLSSGSHERQKGVSCEQSEKGPGEDLEGQWRQVSVVDPNQVVINKRIQMKTLLLLLKRDLRIVPYLLTFIASGAAIVPISFFFVSLSEICHTNNRCDFSQLGGFLQVSMAIAETFLIIYIKQIIEKIGRLNTLSIAFGLTSAKYIFYGTIWPGLNPHYSLLTELTHGVIWGIFLTLSVEIAHLFATEVEFIIPELLENGVIQTDDKESRERLKLSLAATMQALIASASDGLGRGVGALIYGLIIDKQSFHTLWLVIGFGTLVVFVTLQAVNLMDRCFSLQMGLDVAASKRVNSAGDQKNMASNLCRNSELKLNVNEKL